MLLVRRAIIAVGISAVSLGGLALATAPAAHAAGQVCYNVQVNVAGTSLPGEAGCQALP